MKTSCRAGPVRVCCEAKRRCFLLQGLSLLWVTLLSARARDLAVDGVKTERTILVCIPTMARRHGQSFFEQALASVLEERNSTQGVAIQVLVMHDRDSKPAGADHYVLRKPHVFDAPCRFVQWRRNLVLDFTDMMNVALDLDMFRHKGGGFDYVMWLEDDAVLQRGWSRAVLEPAKLRGCLTALHMCNCERCGAEGLYNGVGMVAVIFERHKLQKLLPMIESWPDADPLTALDTMVYQLCAERSELGQGYYLERGALGSLAMHQGNIVGTTTKPGAPIRVQISFPANGQVIYQPQTGVSPLEVHFRLAGMVYDAEYAWTATVSSSMGNQTLPQSTWKVASPLRLEDCSDHQTIDLFWVMDALDMARGANELVSIEVSVFDAEADDQDEDSVFRQAVARAESHFVVTDYMHLAPFKRHTDEDESILLKYDRGMQYLVQGRPGVVGVVALGLTEGVQYALIITAHHVETPSEPSMRHTVLLDDVLLPPGTAERDLATGRQGARAAAALAPELSRGVLEAQVSGNERRGGRNVYAKGPRDSAIFRVPLPSLPVAGQHHLELVVIDAWAMNSVFFDDALASAASLLGPSEPLGYLRVAVAVDTPSEGRDEL